MKTSCIEKFIHYVDWNETNDRDKFVITVIGENSFENALEQLAQSVSIKDKKLKIKYINDINNIDSTHILFISH